MDKGKALVTRQNVALFKDSMTVAETCLWI